MEEIVNLVVQKTGMSPEQARTAVETTLNFVKGKLPPALAAQVDQVVAGGGAGGAGGLGEVAKGLGGMFGKK